MLVDDRSNDLPFLIAVGGAWIGGPNPGWDQAVALIRALEIADDQEIERWAKFAAADDPLAEQVGVRTRAEVIERFEARLRDLGKTAEDDEAHMRLFHALVHEARNIELVDHERIRHWFDHFIVRAPDPDASKGTLRVSLGGSDTELGTIERSIAPPRERKRGLRVDAIEIYEGGLVIRWQHLRPERSYSGELSWPADEVESILSPLPHQLEISDDCGTDFSFSTGGSRGGRTDDGAALSFGTSIYEVRPDPGASRLLIKSAELHFEVDLGASHA